MISTRVGYTGGEVAERDLPQPRAHAEAIEIVFDPAADDLPRPAGVLLPDPRPDHPEPPGQRRRHQLPLGDLLHRRRPEAGRRGHHRRRRRVGAVAGQGRHRGDAGRPVLGGRARAPGLPAAHPVGLHVPLPAAELEAPPPGRRDRLTRSVERVVGRPPRRLTTRSPITGRARSRPPGAGDRPSRTRRPVTTRREHEHDQAQRHRHASSGQHHRHDQQRRRPGQQQPVERVDLARPARRTAHRRVEDVDRHRHRHREHRRQRADVRVVLDVVGGHVQPGAGAGDRARTADVAVAPGERALAVPRAARRRTGS